MIHPICLGLVLTLSMAAGEQLGQVREVPDDWTATELRPLPVAAATASSEAASDDQRYAPRRAVDGHRGTKWVAAVAPSATAPQWITLQLLGAGRQVSTFTLRGEPVDNDGVLDAQVQVLLPAGEFRTVATVRQARSGHWLATFEPVETTAVRLLVTRSGGPSPHTDIYEIGLYGPPLSPEQYLPPSRIGMMQQVLPPGSPPLRPLDLFDRTVPSVWHLHCKNDADQWDVVGLFNFGDRPAERAVDLESLGVPAGGEVAVFEFLEERFLGVHNDRVALTLPPHSCRVLSIRRLA
ncbi:MAG: discoidin domain-containing protein, partial [Pirellulales bacterium]